MDQVKKLLAQYVEWIALALGVAFLGWTIYGYVIQQPVTVAVGPNPAVPPGDINRVIWDQQGKRLQVEVNDHTTVAIPVPAYATKVADDLNAPVPDVVPLAGAWQVDHAPPLPGQVTPDGSLPSTVAQNVTVKALPEVPAAINLQVATGHSYVPDPAAAAAPGKAADKDVAWVTVGFTLPIQTGLAPAFAAVNIQPKPELGATTILAVDGYRQERQPDGNWGPSVLLPKPAFDAVRPLPALTVPNLTPAAVGPQVDFVAWAQANEPLILRPEFYKVDQGDVWYVPGTKNPNERVIQLVADDTAKPTPKPTARPSRPNTAHPPGSNRPGPGGRPGGFGGGGGGGGGGTGGAGGGGPSFAPQAGGGARSQQMSEQGGRPKARPAPVPQQDTPAAPQDGQGEPSAPAAPEAPAIAALPPAPFVPADTPDVQAWLHDDTVLPGKTYRYMVRYTVQSPVFNTRNQCKPANLANTFALTSKDSEWTQAVDVASDTNFFATDVKPNGGIQFDIFKWRNGVWQRQTVIATDGDAIGSADAKGSNDFVTGWTLVDVRDVPLDAKNKTLLLASDNGTLQRELKIDQHDQHYRQLEAAVGDPGQPKTTPPGGFPGMPPGGRGGFGPLGGLPGGPGGYPGGYPGAPGGGGQGGPQR